MAFQIPSLWMDYRYKLLPAGFDGQIECFQSCRPEKVFSFGPKNNRADPFLVFPSDARLANTEGLSCPIREPDNAMHQRIYVQLGQERFRQHSMVGTRVDYGRHLSRVSSSRMTDSHSNAKQAHTAAS